MIKKTLCFSNPAYLSLRNKQLVIKLPEAERADDSESKKEDTTITRPIEDLGVVVLDNKQITITAAALDALLENNCAVITCNAQSMPTGLLLPLAGNTVQAERFRSQIDASLPLRKQLWQQTIQCKIRNQAAVIEACKHAETGCMEAWARDVRSGDPDNLEGRAAVYYWRQLFGHISGFTRDRNGPPPNGLLNYGYAILRAVIARALVSSGMLPTLGIHHHNRYNAYCLADDIMEPYRPYVDAMVYDITEEFGGAVELNSGIKPKLLSIPSLEVTIAGKKNPLFVAASQTTASLQKCFSGELRRISYPDPPCR
jgi:CRISP-associated protein Cas1